MERFTVPQFIDVEDKIIGPVTTRQFLIMMVTFFIITATYAAADFSLFVFLAAVEGAMGGTLAFMRINGRPFHFFIVNIIQTLKRPSLRVWKKDINCETQEAMMVRVHPVIVDPNKALRLPKSLDRMSLKELSLIVDTGGKYTGEEI